MVRATWNGAVIAESDKTVIVEGNHYFPRSAVKAEYLRESDTHTTCPWKGLASYYSIEVNGEVNKDAAWYYPTPKDAAKHITDHIAFWRGVKVESGVTADATQG
jgi:uncharacterized protein (DUF427 family)